MKKRFDKRLYYKISLVLYTFYALGGTLFMVLAIRNRILPKAFIATACISAITIIVLMLYHLKSFLKRKGEVVNDKTSTTSFVLMMLASFIAQIISKNTNSPKVFQIITGVLLMIISLTIVIGDILKLLDNRR